MLACEEGLDVEFKRDIDGCHSEDLVAFANSLSGGTILIGVDESRGRSRDRRPQVVGCPVDDKARQSIFSKADSCTPPVSIEVVVENWKSVPFLRVEIPTGAVKPYCTSSGTYKVRGDGRNKPMFPSHLLGLFLEQESRQFLDRFQSASDSLVATVHTLRDRLGEELENINTEVLSTQDKVDEMFDAVRSTLDDVGSLVEDAQSDSADASYSLTEIGRELEEAAERSDALKCDTMMLRYKIDALLKKEALPDPAIILNEKRLSEVFLQLLAHGATDALLRDLFKQEHPLGSDEEFERVLSLMSKPSTQKSAGTAKKQRK